jgi:hypothetical protein
MSLVNGYLQQMGTTAAKQMLLIEALVYPVVIGNSLVVADSKSVPSNDTGFWQTALAKGVYRLSVTGPVSGKVTSVIIEVPEDNETYAFTELLTEDPELTDLPLGGENEVKLALNIAAMKALPATTGLASLLKLVCLKQPDPGAATFWRYEYGDTTSVESDTVIRDSFGKGTFFAVTP